MKEQFEILLPLILAGEASTEQAKAFFELLEKDEALEAEYKEALKIWLAASAASFDAEKALVTMNLSQPQVVPITKKRRYFPAIAASVAVLLGLFTLFLWRNGGIGSEAAPQLVSVKTTNEIAQVDLPDGSVVWLNKNSQIEYPENFAGKERRVKLTGEAYFDVARNEEKPFVTIMGNSETKVLGTAFNLKEKGTLGYELTVTEGKVSFGIIDDQKPFIVKAGYSSSITGQYWGDGHIREMDENIMAWKTHKMVFKKASADYLAHILSIAYGKPYGIASNKLDDIQFTGTFINKSQAEAQSILSESLGIVFTESKSGVLISYPH